MIPDPYYSLGLLHQSGEEWDEAFEAAVRETGDLRSLYQIGRTAVFSGKRLERGKQAYEEYIASQPDSERLPRWPRRAGGSGWLKLEPDMEQAREALENL